MNESTRIEAAENCLSTTLEGESVILHVDAGKYYGFNEVGTRVWEQVQEPQTIESVCETITDEYDVSTEQCREDVDELVTELIEKDLVHVVDDG
ncbi:PqqD family protein [Halorientalis pallida]|uniref:PqqD family protein n=1 Tax=Halorientalis pallida TaxID=2479928 RepID=UPI003C6F958B